MARREFETVVAQASREALKQTLVDETGSVPINGYREVIVYSSPSTIGRIVGLQALAEAITGGTTGWHEWFFSYLLPTSQPGVTSNIDLTNGRSLPGSAVWFQHSHWITANDKIFPDNTTVGMILQNAQFDDTIGFRMGYFNYSNVATQAAQKRRFFVTYVEREVR
jgi:hypothetical protein